MAPTLPPMEPINDARAWIGADLALAPDIWRKELSGDTISELEQAAAHYLSLGRDIGEITADDFPLPRFGASLAELSHRLIHGIGFEVLTGLPVADYDRQTAAAIFCGIGSHLGSARSQNAEGHILGHVRDTGANPDATDTRIYQTSARQTFHTDSADVVGLLCLKKAREGGESLLVSAITLFNRMVETRPELARLLFDPIATDRRGEVPEGERPFMDIPPLNWHDGLLTVFYQRQYIDSAERFEHAFRLTPAHVEALDLFDALADDPELHLRMQLEPGDIQFVYNHAFLHDRTAFTDWNEFENRRHLLRLWLSMPGDRTLPASFRQRYGSIAVGDRGGIITPATTLHAPLD